MENRDYVIAMMNRSLNMYLDAQEMGYPNAENWLNTFRLYNNLLTEMESK